MSGLISLLITLLILGLIFYVVVWAINWVGVPEPFNKVIKVILGLVVLIFLINLIMGLSGHPVIKWN